MDQNSRSSSVPLIHINVEEDDEALVDNSTHGDSLLSIRLPRSSFSLSSLSPILASPWNLTKPNCSDSESESEHVEIESMSHSCSISTSSINSSLLSDDEDGASIAMTGRKAYASQSSTQKDLVDLSSDILYEDIWVDSPVFHEYLTSLETWLYHYLTWLEKIEQCRQLEIAYSKSVALLYDQTKLMLNEPFYSHRECNGLNWPNDNTSSVDEKVWDNEDIRSILPYLREHGAKIKETLTNFQSILALSRSKYVQSSLDYCALQKLKSSQTNKRPFDDIITTLYVSKRTLCKSLLEYIHSLNSLIRSTRNLVNDKLSPLFEGLLSDKHRNLKTLEELVLVSTDFIYDINSKKETSSTTSINLSSMPGSNTAFTEDHIHTIRSNSPVPTNTTTRGHSSFEDYNELNNERLSYYIQDKLANYYSCLRNSCSILKSQYANDSLFKNRPNSPNSLIPFGFLNKPRLVRYNSLDSLLSNSSSHRSPSATSHSLQQLATKGYLLLKKKSNSGNSTCTNGISSAATGGSHNLGNNGNKWERYYFYITKEDGHLKQYKDQSTTVVLTNLNTATAYASETDKRDFVILISSTVSSSILSLQAENAAEFSSWLQALRSWNPSQHKRKTNTISTVTSTTTSNRGTGGGRATKKSSVVPPARKNANPYQRSNNHGENNATIIQAINTNLAHPNNNNLSSSPTAVHRTSPTFLNNAESTNGEMLFGFPIPVTDCPINCCNSSTHPLQQMPISKVQMTGLFRIHKLCVNKLSCNSHHTGTLCVLHVTLFENGVLHLQTEKDGNSFFHRPIQLANLSSQDIYSLSDSIDHMRYCIVIRPQPSETYHLMTCSKIQRDAWLVRLKRSCTQHMQQPPLTGIIPMTVLSRKVFTLTVRISEGRRFQVNHKDSIHSELYCDIVIDNEIRGLTGTLKKTSQIFWREEFLFSDISKMKHGVTISIFSRSSKNDRETIYGTVFLPVLHIGTGRNVIEDWYEVRKETNNRNRAFASLTSLGSSNHQTLGQLRVGLLLEEHQVFALETYQPLMDVLTEFRHDIVYEMARKTSDVQGLARSLLRIYEGMGLTTVWIKSLIDYEVASLSSDDVNILFRGNTFFTKVIDNFTKMSGKEFLEEALQVTIQKICKFSLHIEVETSRLSNSTTENVQKNCSELFSHVRSIWSGIQKAKSKCPIELRHIFGHLQSAVVKKFDLGKETLDRHHQVAKYTCVSGFIFLRWICPAIISPKQFGLVQDHPDTQTCRTLTLIAKCLMALASHSTSEQNSKEPWIIRLNEFVQSNTHLFMNFINFVSVDDESSKDKNDNILLLRHKQEEIIAPYFIDLALELSQFTTWCAQECNTQNVITRTCKSIDGGTPPSRVVASAPIIASYKDEIDDNSSASSSSGSGSSAKKGINHHKRKTRPQPWQYGDDYVGSKQDLKTATDITRSFTPSTE